MGGNVEAYYDSLETKRVIEYREKLESVGGQDWPSWAKYYFTIAHAVKLKSKDRHTKIGSVIVGPDGEIVSTGYNSLARGMDDLRPERYERPEKYIWMEHAERNAIYNAARIGVSTKTCEMFMTCDMSCIDCARAIIQSGIIKIHLLVGEGAKGTKYKDQMETSERMFRESGIIIHKYDSEFKRLRYNPTKLR